MLDIKNLDCDAVDMKPIDFDFSQPMDWGEDQGEDPKARWSLLGDINGGRFFLPCTACGGVEGSEECENCDECDENAARWCCSVVIPQ